MSKKSDFINYLEENFFNKANDIPEDIVTYWEAFKGKDGTNKPILTDNGKLSLKYMQDHQDMEMMKAKDMADGMVIASRTVSGSIRKLVTDGFVEKIGQNPVTYCLTEKGKKFNIDEV